MWIVWTVWTAGPALAAGTTSTPDAPRQDARADDVHVPDRPAPSDERHEVVGGTDAAPGLWPDAAALFTINDTFVCTGTLIAPDLVLTAGHCGYGLEYAVVGTDDHTAGGQAIEIIESHAHPDYFTTFDVAVLVLAEPATVPPRPLALDCIALDYVHDGAEVAIVGYGATDEWANEWTTRLQQADTTVSDAVCDDLSAGCNPPVSPGGELIAGGDGVDSCNGDSGGPLYLRTDEGDFLAGVTSRAAVPSATPCGGGGIYVRVDAVDDWIEEVTGRVLSRPDCDDYNRAPHPAADPIEVGPGSTGFTRVEPNDPNPDDGHRYELVRAPARGLIDVRADGWVAYTPEPGRAGPADDSFVVRVIDDGQPEASAELEIPVQVLPGVPGRAVEPEPRGCTTAGTGSWSPWLLAGLLAARRHR